MRMSFVGVLCVVVAIGALVMAGCKQKPPESQPGKTVTEQTGGAMEKTGEAVKEAAGTAVEKTGEAVEKAGAEMEKAGAAMEKAGEAMTNAAVPAPAPAQ
jgi:hypothetical protein